MAVNIKYFFILKLSILKKAKILSLTSSPVNFCRTKMAGKNSKKATSSSRIPPNKLPDVKPELVTPSQLVKYDPHQITQINSPDKPSSSRMVPLGKPVQSTSFAKALSSDYDPFNKKLVPATPAAPIKSRNAKTVSPYVPLYAEKLFYIEFFHRGITNPLSLIKGYFPIHPTDGIQQHFSPSDPYKTIHFYQNILQQEGSVVIKSIYDKFHDKKLLYHKIEIVKFTSMRQWGDPFSTKPLQGHSIQYSYYDYIDAWYKILLYQFDDMSHFWFVQWHEKYKFIKPECQPPMWFIKWWSKHGSQAKIIPDTLWNTKIPTKPDDPPVSTHTLKEALSHFIKMYKCTEYNNKFPPILLLCAKYKVPWIVKWSYQIKDHTLIRNFSVKWWDSYNRDRIIKFVFDDFLSK
jgi:hypothetical protein